MLPGQSFLLIVILTPNLLEWGLNALLLVKHASVRSHPTSLWWYNSAPTGALAAFAAVNAPTYSLLSASCSSGHLLRQALFLPFVFFPLLS